MSNGSLVERRFSLSIFAVKKHWSALVYQNSFQRCCLYGVCGYIPVIYPLHRLKFSVVLDTNSLLKIPSFSAEHPAVIICSVQAGVMVLSVAPISSNPVAANQNNTPRQIRPKKIAIAALL
eukprot:Gb_13094 [translate_table: standard]